MNELSEDENNRVIWHREYKDAMKVIESLKYLVTADPGRPFQQWIFDVHEQIHNTTGFWPEQADVQTVTNDMYCTAIMDIVKKRE